MASSEQFFYSPLPIRHSPIQKKRPRKGSIMQLKDVAVLITGGGSGLGAATARAMAAKGAKIAVLDQSKENAEKVAAEVKGVAVHADVTDEEQVKAGLAKAESAHGVARVLMNCAGIGGFPALAPPPRPYSPRQFHALHQCTL